MSGPVALMHAFDAITSSLSSSSLSAFASENMNFSAARDDKSEEEKNSSSVVVELGHLFKRLF